MLYHKSAMSSYTFWKTFIVSWTLCAVPAICSVGQVESWCENCLDRPFPSFCLAALSKTVSPTPTCLCCHFLSMVVAQCCSCFGQGRRPKLGRTHVLLSLFSTTVHRPVSPSLSRSTHNRVLLSLLQATVCCPTTAEDMYMMCRAAEPR